MNKLFAFCIGVTLAAPSLARAEVLDFGQPVPQATRTKKAVEPALPAPKKIIFGDEDPVVGVLRGVDGTGVVVVPPSKFGNLIMLRASFVPEMLKSAENF